ncbi:hypothetical protein BIV57_22750 [Mangrovactinospora gilvigrisea]|uniref:DUF1003 domain-containing protein n=1 Tax=Mangrovactinospora gilvigrisea TaxID=1428644 RepID=A0A1J7BP45_9ACTN|nr:DUF1003 domain-containing protein [Mangrovactinospora gilvigrisea]OIV35225.1 hypothetical protein BIV57_22750 [Mangrovactinospora gilvigrisea]
MSTPKGASEGYGTTGSGDRRDRTDRERSDRDRPDRRRRGDRARRRAAGREERARLDEPRLPRPRWLPTAPSYDPDAFGRLSEQIARFLGTGRFIVWMTVFVVVWVGWNVLAPANLRFDNYPFIFLTLALSLQASYAAPLILLAQNRQDDRDRVNLEQDRRRNDRNIADTEYLTREVAGLRVGLGEVATRDFVRSELQSLLRELDERYGPAEDGGGDEGPARRDPGATDR